MGPIQDRIGNRQWLVRMLCASALLAHGAFAAPADPLVSPQEQAITQQFQKLAPPKTDAFKPQRSDWKSYKKLQGRAVYRHAKVFVGAASAMTASTAFTPAIKNRPDRDGV